MMSAGDRNNKGKPIDIVRHFGNSDVYSEAICKTKNAGYITDDISDVTCKKCHNYIIKHNIWYKGK